MDYEPIAKAIIENSKKPLSELSITQKFILYRMSSVLYYHFNDNMIQDTEYDLLCKDLYNNYEKIESPNGITKEDLEAGTGFSIDFETNTFNIVQTIRRLLV
jgi:hypothetical protein